MVVGLSASPPEVAAWMKYRLGQVGPGSGENHQLKMAKFCASADSTGNRSGRKYSMTCLAAPAKVSPCAFTEELALNINPFMGAGSVGGLGIGGWPATAACGPQGDR